MKKLEKQPLILNLNLVKNATNQHSSVLLTETDVLC